MILPTSKSAAFLLFLSSLTTQPTVVTASKNQYKILEIFYNRTNGDNWTNKQWNISDTSVCNSDSYPGVLCNDENKIIEIDLHRCGLSGRVPPWIYALPKLTKLTLSDNALKEGGWDRIADIAGNDNTGYVLSPKLESITLTSNQISSVEGIEQLKDTLTELHLTYNSIAGAIPDELFELKKLKILSISENGITGTIDKRLGTLTDLNELYCYGNEVVGQIPDEIGQLKKLQILTVS